MKWFKCQEDGNDYIWILFREKGGGTRSIGWMVTERRLFEWRQTSWSLDPFHPQLLGRILLHSIRTHTSDIVYTHIIHPLARLRTYGIAGGWKFSRIRVLDSRTKKFSHFFSQIFLLFGISFRTGRRRTEESGGFGSLCVVHVSATHERQCAGRTQYVCVCGGKRIIRAKGEIEGVGWKSNFLFVYSATS